ncbi:MAG: hypothetical protein C3F11_01170 [Methylocystaceae bacterium]|nr:MAG: hypothetical protein C3F11_01170 [Methylocystaceae bacterium]
MCGNITSPFLRHATAALYALALIVIAVGNGVAAHAHISGAGTPEAALRCHDAQSDHGDPANFSHSCCDACTVSAPSIVPPTISHIIFRLEIVTRFDFASRLGDDRDHSPEDLRSRAPPAII